MPKFEALKERALVNFEHLLHLWQIEYHRINASEYDFINPTRKDTRHGACRFNITKGTGADFTGTGFTSADYQSIGSGFTKEDFAGITRGDSNNWGFDIIGLCQRLHGLHTYQDAATLLRNQLKQLRDSKVNLNRVEPGAREAREHKRSEQKLKTLRSAEFIWKLCQDYKGTIAENYFHSRAIYLVDDEPSIRFHAKIYNKELDLKIPAVLFKVTENPTSPITAIHRIYIAKDGSRKAKINNQKMALGSIQGAGIWFGDPGPKLAIVEGPENALSIRVLGFPFVACTINATNFSNLTIPKYVKEIVLLPDPDKAGRENAHKAVKAYGRSDATIKIVFPPEKKLENGKLADWNDILKSRSGISVSTSKSI